MISLLIFLAILSILIVVHELGHFIVAKKMGVRVEQFSLGFGPQLLKKKIGETEYSLAAIPLGGFVKLAGDNLEEYKGQNYEYFSKPVSARFKIIFFGPLLNYVLGFLCFWLIFFAGYPNLTTKVGGLLDGFGAKAAGIITGDKIIAIDGEKVEYWDDMQRVIQEKKDSSSVRLLVGRAGNEQTIIVALKSQEMMDALGEKRNVGLLGVTPSDEIVKVRHNIADAFFLGAGKTWDLTVMTLKGLWRMITGKLSVRESVTGPLGIFFITSKAASMGFIAVLHLIGVLSISLGIFNLLPLPVLDGGHILFLAIEKIRGKPFSLKTEQVIARIGATLIISLAVIVTYNDILRFFGDKIARVFK